MRDAGVELDPVSPAEFRDFFSCDPETEKIAIAFFAELSDVLFEMFEVRIRRSEVFSAN
ncbi:MAG: hypothetical protein QW540_09205 [Archaeoglobaceae archaeon]